MLHGNIEVIRELLYYQINSTLANLNSHARWIVGINMLHRGDPSTTARGSGSLHPTFVLVNLLANYLCDRSFFKPPLLSLWLTPSTPSSISTPIEWTSNSKSRLCSGLLCLSTNEAYLYGFACKGYNPSIMPLATSGRLE